jgi:hypothetical protein
VGTSDERGLKRTAKSCGSGAPKQALRSRDTSCERRRQPSKGHRGERDINRNTIAQGMPIDPAEPVVTAACVFCCRRAMGEVITRHSLRPLRFLRAKLLATLGRECVAGSRVCASSGVDVARSERSELIQRRAKRRINWLALAMVERSAGGQIPDSRSNCSGYDQWGRCSSAARA